MYGYWNQGGLANVQEAFYFVAKEYLPGITEVDVSSDQQDSDQSISSKIKQVVNTLTGGGIHNAQSTTSQTQTPDGNPAARVLPPGD